MRYNTGVFDGAFQACRMGDDGHNGFGVSKEGGELDRVVIKTGAGNPERKLDRKPFSDAYQLFEEALRACRAICAIGFEFRDRDVVNALVRALRDEDRQRRLLVVDRFLNKEEVIRRLERGGRRVPPGSIAVISRDLRDSMCIDELASALAPVFTTKGVGPQL